MANNAKDSQLIELKDTISNLNKQIETLQQSIDSINSELKETASERDNYKEQLETLKQRFFGSKSEKSKRDSEFEGQLNLFNDFEVAAAEVSSEDTDNEETESEAEDSDSKDKQKKRKKRITNSERFNGLPVKKKYLEPESKTCPDCGATLEYFGCELVRKELVVVPAKVYVREVYSNNYKCPDCTPDKKLPVIVKGKDGKAHMLYGMASSSTIAYIIYQKFVNSMPLYRQEQDFKRFGVSITRSTLASWVIKNSDKYFTKLFEYWHRKLLQREFVMADETATQVLKEPGRRAESKSYMWVFRTGEDGGIPIILFKYSPTRAGETAYNFLEDYSGYLMCDGYSGYNKVPKAKRTVCWAHLRRYLIESVPKSKLNDYTLPAVQGIMYCNKLFDLEKKIKAKYKTPEDIKKARIELETPILAGFWSWFDGLTTVKNTKFDRARTYIKNRRKDVERYLEDGRCSFSNNLSENSIRPFTVGRKNWLFSDSQAGANSSATMYSIIETAKANEVNVYRYLEFLLDKLPTLSGSDEDFESVSPWNESVKAEIERRVQEAYTE